MNESLPDHHCTADERRTHSLIALILVLSFFAGVNLWSWMESFEKAAAGLPVHVGYPYNYYYSQIVYGTSTSWFDYRNMLTDLAIAFGAAMCAAWLVRNGWWEFWHWLRTAGIEYEPPEDEPAQTE